MIAHIRGLLSSKQPPHIVVDVQGVGYDIQMPMSCFYQLPDTGAEVTVLTHFVVREDAQLLYGFITPLERHLFQQLIKAQGVGPKLALTILSGMSAQQFTMVIQQSDVASLVKLPGVGKKTAERLVVEMRDRLKDLPLMATPATDAMPADNEQLGTTLIGSDSRGDALSALLALGYKAAQAEKAVKTVANDGMSSEEIIRQALKSMA
ncbi:Holliday junction branch migration protein RuvA [Idiomarina xiamenensis]|uniref:Holliday junction branch migration complex subunit RuvA n=1 Tax=Idiomarina xiamenensis 10-D-4 TaxID=740709 RepID=K2JBY9_9GAMM|nr:Holliday junction branch migration protein RuvA [Idiomarina xiamenensis]EKE80791.1 Holliday junction resolvasome, DNA-binding subunit [Idiomarina xiamenensis 10-D-4]